MVQSALFLMPHQSIIMLFSDVFTTVSAATIVDSTWVKKNIIDSDSVYYFEFNRMNQASAWAKPMQILVERTLKSGIVSASF